MAIFRQLTPQQIYEHLQDPRDNLILVDVRTPDEWRREGYIEGARLIPIDELRERAAKELPRDAEIIIYCHSGMRSYAASTYLAQVGYNNVTDLSGGLSKWIKSRLPVARD